MKKLFAVIACAFCLLSLPAFALTFNTCWGTNEAAAAANSITVSVSPTGGSGHLLVGFARYANLVAGTISFADNSGSNSWSPVGAIQITGGIVGQMYYSSNPVAGTYTVTANFSNNITYRGITVCEWSGLASSNVLDSGSISGVCTPATATCTSSAFTTTNANDLVVMMAAPDAIGTFSAGSIGGSAATAVTTNSNDIGGDYALFSSTRTNVTAAIKSGAGHLWSYGVGAFKTATQ